MPWRRSSGARSWPSRASTTPPNGDSNLPRRDSRSRSRPSLIFLVAMTEALPTRIPLAPGDVFMRSIKLNASSGDLPGGAAEIPSEDAQRRAIEAELGRFQGTWKFVSIEAEGDRASQKDLVSVTVVIQGNRFTLRNGPTIDRGILTVDPTVIPKTINVAFSEGTQRGTISQGIYELDDHL